MKRVAAATLALSLAVVTAEASPASERAAALYRAGDYETAVRDAPADPNDVELNAWVLAATLRTLDGGDATAAARALTVAHPENPWSWFALVQALLNSSESGAFLESSETMMRVAGENAPPDLIALRAAALLNADKKAEALKLLDDALARRPDDVVLLNARADYGAESEQLACLQRAMRAQPSSVAAFARAGNALIRRRRAVEAVELLQHATELSPRALYTRQAYWRAVHALTELTAAQKQQVIEDDLAAFVRDRADLPSTLAAAAREYAALGLRDRACEAEERVLADAPHSTAAASVLWARAQDFRKDRDEAALEEPGNRAEYRRLLRAVVDDPQRSIALHGNVYVALLASMRRDRTVSATELRHVVEEMERYEKENAIWRFVYAPIALADRGVALDYAESLARQALPAMQKSLEGQRSMYETEDDFKMAMARMTGMAHDAIGWVLVAKKQWTAARRELLAATVADPQNADAFYHLGRYYETRQLPAKAEDAYVQGSRIVNALDNRNRDALKTLYRKRHGGSAAGFAAYRKSLEGTDAAKRKQKVLATRSTPARSVLPFKLATLGGAPLSLDDLHGKVAVINFWGIWCGWCVRELPELQTLVRTYAKDPAVRIVTINNDGDVDKVRQWMSSKKYDFPVLFDDGWLARAEMHSFPTTWFLDRSGRIAFTKVGWSEKLIDEFTWRIEALKAD